MTPRERRYHWRKSRVGIWAANTRDTVAKRLWEYGIAGTKVCLGADGMVRAYILSPEETEELAHKVNNGEGVDSNISYITI